MYRQDWVSPGIRGMARNSNSIVNIQKRLIKEAVHPGHIEKIKQLLYLLIKSEMELGRKQINVPWKIVREVNPGANYNDINKVKAFLVEQGFRMIGRQNVSWSQMTQEQLKVMGENSWVSVKELKM